MDLNNEIKYKQDGNRITVFLHQDCYSKEALQLFAYELSTDYLTYLDKENDYYKLCITIKNENPDDIQSIINRINDCQLVYTLNQRTEHLRNSIVDYAFGKKKVLNENPRSYLPFTFKRLNDSSVMIVSYAGEFLILPAEAFLEIIHNRIPKNESIVADLIQKNILSEADVNLSFKLIATKYRSRKAFLRDFTSLHMIVLTKACNCQCIYCQASSQPESNSEIHMSKETAKKVVNMIFSSPSRDIKVEFQGGEPLLNWEVLKFIVDYAELLNKLHQRRLTFVICSNLTGITDDMIEFIRSHHISVSTSLDGPRDIHDKNRPCRNGESSYDLLLNNLKRMNHSQNNEACSALVTITRDTLPRLKDIIDEYRAQGLKGIFLRPVNPYGNAKKEWEHLFCNVDDFITQYKDALSYILEINMHGEYFVEYYTVLLLSRILTPFATGFVDLQSPSGAGISGAMYDYNGDVYPSDEARMLAREGDYYFRLGNVHQNKYCEIFLGEKLKDLCKSSILEGLPGCSTCVYQAFCGADPVRYYVEYGPTRGYRPTSNFCRRNKGMFDYLFELINSQNQDIVNVFWSWLTRRDLAEVKL
jgi:His-Xaa-Ser repeat-associated upstream radical SAM protein